MNIRTVFAIGKVTVDLGNELLKDARGNPIALRRQSFAVLRHLIEHADHLVTKDELIAAVWPGIAVTDDSLIQCIHEIRRALGDEGHLILKTAPKRGYRLALPREVESKAIAEAMPVLPARAGSNIRLGLAIAALSAIVAAAVSWWVSSLPTKLNGPLESQSTIAENVLQTEIVGSIVSALAVRLSPALPDPVETRNAHAYDALLLGMERLHLDTREDTLKAIGHFEKALRLDPDYGRAHAAMAAAELRTVVADWPGNSDAELDAAHAGLRLHLAAAMRHPTPPAYTVAAEWALQTGRAEEALPLVEKAKALAPNDAAVLVSEARVLNAIGRAAEAEADLRLAMRLDPNFAPATLRVLSASLFEQGRYWESIETIGRIKAQGAATADDYITIVASLGQIGVSAGVGDAVDRYNDLAFAAGREAMTVQEAQWRWNGGVPGHHRPYAERLVAGLRKAGVPEGAGADISPDRYATLVYKGNDGEFAVDGAPELAALTAGSLFDRGVTFVDVQSSAGYAAAHVPRAINLSLVSKLSKDELMKVARPEKPIVFYCGSRYCADAAIAAAKAVLWGYTQVYRLEGGVPGWKKADCPTEIALN